jgi:hypothetical protein
LWKTQLALKQSWAQKKLEDSCCLMQVGHCKDAGFPQPGDSQTPFMLPVFWQNTGPGFGNEKPDEHQPASSSRRLASCADKDSGNEQSYKNTKTKEGLSVTENGLQLHHAPLIYWAMHASKWQCR